MLAEGIPGGFSSLYDSLAALETLGVARRGYFVEGLGGAQFALPGAVERLRAQRDDDAAPPRRARRHRSRRSPTAPPSSGPKREGRSPGAHGRRATSCSPAPSPCSTSSAAARACRSSSAEDDARLAPALEALAEAVQRGRVRRLALERVDGEPVVGSPYEERLLELGFRAGPAQAHADRLKAAYRDRAPVPYPQ